MYVVMCVVKILMQDISARQFCLRAVLKLGWPWSYFGMMF